MELDLEWLQISAGTFWMGTAEDECEQLIHTYKSRSFLLETPRRKVFVPTFHISKYPVTNRQFQEFVDATNYRAGTWLAWHSEETSDHPVRSINLYDAMAFCHWVGCRLPTEVEWEKAAAGPEGAKYPWGNEWDPKRCNSRESGAAHSTVSVASFPNGASAYGVHGMAGNVWEWTLSWLVSDRAPAIWWALDHPAWNVESDHTEGYDYKYIIAL
jgi:formylglycine-generating enzyme required for sulfatase activity